jgi:riboflavin-specific deaminase-like protein
MRMLWPTPAADVDPLVVYAAPERAPVGERPWVLVNMISTVDGAAADPTGRSGGLGGPADRRVFGAVRAVADVIMAGAGTIRGENYRPARLPDAVMAVRTARGQAERPRIAVVSASLRLDPGTPLFDDPTTRRPLVVTTESADPTARRRLEPVADIVVAGRHRVDWRSALAAVREATGAAVVVVEGGPSVNGQLVDEGLVDELCLTLGPSLAGGTAPRIAAGRDDRQGDGLRPLRLAHVLESDGFLLLRYIVDHTGRAAAGQEPGTGPAADA